MGGPDPGVARGTPRDAQVSAAFLNSPSHGTPGSERFQRGRRSVLALGDVQDKWGSLGEKKMRVSFF